MKLSKTIFVLIAAVSMIAWNSLGARHPTIAVTAENPVITFVWDGTFPTIEEKELYGEQYLGYSDEMMFEVLVNDALSTWTAVEGAFIVLELGRDDDVVFDIEDGVFALKVSAVGATTAAAALPRTDEETGYVIEDCDIEVGEMPSSAKSLGFTILHEIGHCLGLGHVHSNKNAVMGYSRQNENMTLGADDVAGLVFLYGSDDDQKVKEAVSCGVSGKTSEGNNTLLALFLFSPLLLCCFTFRRKQSY